ncbi:hypothetical protein [Nocardia alni]|uniref:hypothetical protein n=1 Tax=Nocardia alni TaxID=2815723 RepID=UPI001C21A137|nr:hypothetical protein [Nocardia alni]
MRRSSRTGSPMVRAAGRVMVAAAVLAAPVVTASAAMADPAPQPAAEVASGPAIVPVDYGGWYYWHCQVHHEWWRPACHPGNPRPPYPQPYPPSGSAA